MMGAISNRSGIYIAWILLLLASVGNAIEVLEYCENEVLEPKCESNEVLLIAHARYGRMRTGRCLSAKHGNLACHVDARVYLDAICSGRQSCQVTVATLVPTSDQMCPMDLRSYLEIVYECVKVVYASKDYCQNSEAVEVREPEGYLSSLVTMETGCGSLDSPWWVTVQPGQTITLILLDFDIQEAPPVGKHVCHVYAVIKEQGASKMTETVCAGNSRERKVFTSASNRLEVRLVTGSEQSERRNSHFLLRFEANGCPNLPAPINGWVNRVDNEATIGCQGDATHRWKLHCEGVRWSGTYSNCTDGDTPMPGSSTQTWSLLSQKHGLSVLIILCIAVTVGLCILAVGMFYIRRRRRSRDDREVVHIPPEIQYGPAPPQDKPAVPLTRPYNKTGDSTEYYHSTENDYYRTWQLQRHTPQNTPLPAVPVAIPPPPPYGAQAQASRSAGSGSNGGYQKSSYPPNEHIYESPKFDRKDYSSDDYEIDGLNTEYFELDPDAPKPT